MIFFGPKLCYISRLKSLFYFRPEILFLGSEKILTRQRAEGSPLHGHLTVLGSPQHPCPPKDRGFNVECLKKRASRSRILVFIFISRKRGGPEPFPSATAVASCLAPKGLVTTE